MGKGTENLFTLSGGFNITGQQPIDSRIVVKNVADLYSADTWNGVGLYNGLVVAVQSTGALFVLKNRDNYTDQSSWVAVGGDVSADLTSLTDRVDNIDDKLNISANSGLDITSALKVKIDSTVDGNILQVSENGLSVVASQSEYSLDSVETPESGYAAQYQFKKDGQVQATINIPKDQFLKNASYDADNDELVFVFDTATGESTSRVSVKDLVDTYTAGDYIQINDANAISLNLVKLLLDLGLNDKFAQIEANTTAIGDANSGLVADVAKNTSDIETLNTNYKNLRSSVTALENLDVVNGIDDTATYGIGLASTTDADGKVTAKVSVDIDKLAAAVVPVASKIHVTDFGTYKDSNVQAVLENLDTRITAAAGGGVQSIVTNPGSGIAVDSSDVNNPAISINIEEDSALTINENNKIDLVWSEL
jgi:hypothetical protein